MINNTNQLIEVDMRKLIFFVVFFIWTSNIVHAYETSKETYCAQAFGFSTLDDMKKELLLNAKRSAVNKLFGELITASTSVENLVLTSDQIRTSSIGFVRIEGDLTYFHGKNLGEVCVQATAYATEDDKEKFKPVKLSKRACASDSGSSARNLKITAEKNAITNALIEYERRLSVLDPDMLLRLMRQVTFSESGFISDTETYCTRATGIVYPIEIIAAASAFTEEHPGENNIIKKIKDKKIDTEPSFAQDFSKIILTRTKNVGKGKGTLIAPGNGNQKYTIHLIDTKDFKNGGNITFRISIGDGESDASFDLFPEGVQIPTSGRPNESVVGKYDISRGSTVTMSYRFKHGQVFQFGAEGNWFSRKDSENNYSFDVRVTE